MLFLDFDGDNQLGCDDLSKTLKLLTSNELSEDEISFVIDKVSFVCDSYHSVSRLSKVFIGRQLSEPCSWLTSTNSFFS